MKTVCCMGVEADVWGHDEGASFDVGRFPFEASANNFAGLWTWRLKFYGGIASISGGDAASLAECVTAIDAARLDALSDLAAQLQEPLKRVPTL